MNVIFRNNAPDLRDENETILGSILLSENTILIGSILQPRNLLAQFHFKVIDEERIRPEICHDSDHVAFSHTVSNQPICLATSAQSGPEQGGLRTKSLGPSQSRAIIS
jgi:hypothetical protein